MLTSPTFTVPGAEGIAAAYAEMRHYGVTPLVASDWLTEQIEATAHQDIAQQVERNHGAPAERPVTVDARVRLEIDRAINVAVAVYNRQRSRVTNLDQIATEAGAAAINRAAVARQTRTNDTDRATLIEPRVDTVQVTPHMAVHYVAAVLTIGPRARAISARFTSNGKNGVRLTHFDVLMP